MQNDTGTKIFVWSLEVGGGNSGIYAYIYVKMYMSTCNLINYTIQNRYLLIKHYLYSKQDILIIILIELFLFIYKFILYSIAILLY